MNSMEFSPRSLAIWILANAFGFALCMSVPMAATQVFYNQDYILGIGLILVGSALIGVIQWLILRPRISAWWAPATAGGLFLAMAGTIFMLISMFAEISTWFMLSISVCAMGAILGGVPQWLVLRLRISRSWYWVLVSAIALVLCMSAASLGMLSSMELFSELENWLSGSMENALKLMYLDLRGTTGLFLGGLAGGFIYGLITGLALFKLLKLPESPISDSRPPVQDSSKSRSRSILWIAISLAVCVVCVISIVVFNILSTSSNTKKSGAENCASVEILSIKDEYVAIANHGSGDYTFTIKIYSSDPTAPGGVTEEVIERTCSRNAACWYRSKSGLPIQFVHIDQVTWVEGNKTFSNTCP